MPQAPSSAGRPLQAQLAHNNTNGYVGCGLVLFILTYRGRRCLLSLEPVLLNAPVVCCKHPLGKQRTHRGGHGREVAAADGDAGSICDISGQKEDDLLYNFHRLLTDSGGMEPRLQQPVMMPASDRNMATFSNHSLLTVIIVTNSGGHGCEIRSSR